MGQSAPNIETTILGAATSGVRRRMSMSHTHATTTAVSAHGSAHTVRKKNSLKLDNVILYIYIYISVSYTHLTLPTILLV